MHAGGGKVDLPGAAAVPHAHVSIGVGTPRLDTVPGAQALKDALAGHGQCTDPRFEGCQCVERFAGQRPAVDQEDVQAAVAQGERQGAADHASADDDQVGAQFVGVGHCIHCPLMSDRVPRPMAWRANQRLAGGSRSSPSRPRLRPTATHGSGVANKRVSWSEKPTVRF